MLEAADSFQTLIPVARVGEAAPNAPGSASVLHTAMLPPPLRSRMAAPSRTAPKRQWYKVVLVTELTVPPLTLSPVWPVYWMSVLLSESVGVPLNAPTAVSPTSMPWF